MKTKQIVAAYGILSGSKLTKMSAKEKVKVVKILMALKPVHKGYADKVEEAMNRLKPEWLTDEKKHEWDTRGVWSDKLTGEEKDGINDYLKSVDLCLKDDFEKETDISFDHLTDEEFEHLADSNDFTAGQLMELQGWIA